MHGELLIVVGIEMRQVGGNVQEPFDAWIVTVQWRRTNQETLVFRLILQTWEALVPHPPSHAPPDMQ